MSIAVKGKSHGNWIAKSGCRTVANHCTGLLDGNKARVKKGFPKYSSVSSQLIVYVLLEFNKRCQNGKTKIKTSDSVPIGEFWLVGKTPTFFPGSWQVLTRKSCQDPPVKTLFFVPNQDPKFCSQLHTSRETTRVKPRSHRKNTTNIQGANATTNQSHRELPGVSARHINQELPRKHKPTWRIKSSK